MSSFDEQVFEAIDARESIAANGTDRPPEWTDAVLDSENWGGPNLGSRAPPT